MELVNILLLTASSWRKMREEAKAYRFYDRTYEIDRNVSADELQRQTRSKLATIKRRPHYALKLDEETLAALRELDFIKTQRRGYKDLFFDAVNDMLVRVSIEHSKSRKSSRVLMRSVYPVDADKFFGTNA